MLIQFENVTKIYKMGEDEILALKDVSFSIEEGEFIAIFGPSGSGKSTMLNIIGCLDYPTSGKYLLEGIEIDSFKKDELSKIRNQKIGFVFQTFNLLPRMNALENVELPLIYGGHPSSERKNIAYNALSSVGLPKRIKHRPSELSGGEQQRVAIARAIVNNPKLILADEPTGNIDSQTGKEIMEIFKELSKRGVAIVLVTHDEGNLMYVNRVIKLQDGRMR